MVKIGDMVLVDNLPVNGAERTAAIVTKVHTDECVNLTAFMDGHNLLMCHSSVLRKDHTGPGATGWLTHELAEQLDAIPDPEPEVEVEVEVEVEDDIPPEPEPEPEAATDEVAVEGDDSEEDAKK